MNKGKLVFSGIGLVLLLMMLTVCEQEPVFESSEYRISADRTSEELNIEDPQHIHSTNEAVATARIDAGEIIIVSVGQGGTTVYIGDSVGLSNSARIEVNVDAAGKIQTQIQKFDGSKVTVTVKENVVISGTVGSAITSKEIYLMMDGTDFIATTNGMDASSWIDNLPAGLSASISYVQSGEHPHEVKITVSGTPQSASSESVKITIPAANSARGWDVYIGTQSKAKFEIL